jgi:DNA-binding HxlR family transcriptional regulator
MESMKTQEPQAFCPYYRHAVELIGRRWTGAILRAMLFGVTRFSDLAETIPGVSDRMLSERLKELEAEGLVLRSVIPETPVRIEYHLTEKGRSLWSVVEAVAGWAEEWLARPSLGGSDAEAQPPAALKASQ